MPSSRLIETGVYMLLKIRERFGERVKDLRKQKGMTQERLAEKAGLHISLVSLIERGQTNPTLDTMNKLSKGLKVPIWEVFMGMEEEHRKPAMRSLREKKLVRKAR